MRNLIKSTYYKVDYALMTLCKRSGFLSSIYYLIFNRSFRRENQSVVAGKLAYYDSFKRDDAITSPLLRRNVHRLEKGLIMRPRRASFAKDYILETVQEYVRVRDLTAFSEKERLWARDVLRRYFSVITPEGDIETARHLLEQAGFFDIQVDPRAPSMSPTPRRAAVVSDISYEAFHKLVQRRRAVRWFKPGPVDMDKVQRAIDIAAYAPSACNRQPYRFVTLKGEEAVKVAGYAMGTSGFAENIPALMVLTGDLSAYPYERDRHIIYIDGSLAAMGFMLALETLGLSSCPINWPDIEKREQLMSDHLNLPKHVRPIMLIAVGEALEEGEVPFSQKNAAAQLMKRMS